MARRSRNNVSQWVLVAALTAMFLLVAVAAYADDSNSAENLRALSIDDLANVQVYSVGKTAQKLSDAAAAIYVITHDEIMRSGATTLPEILRLAPNLQVAQVSGSGYAISARGFNGTTTDNGAGNKLLVLIDGRSVYTPLYGGVFWDLQYVPPEDIDHIEVISGPGAALWGANAVNGVINIITRNSSEAQGALLRADGGNGEQGFNLQFGGKISDDASFRVYGAGFLRDPDSASNGLDSKDGWSKYQGGFRVDWRPGDALVTVQGDLFGGSEQQSLPPNAVIGGNNVLARWNQPFADGSALQVQAYYDFNMLRVRGSLGDGIRTYDLDIQHSFSWGARQDIVWGGGVRLTHDEFDNTPSIEFLPAINDETLANLFIQDSISLSDSVKLTVGNKFESDPFVGLQVQPSGRLSWKFTDSDMLWGAISRAVRAPTLWDRDLNELSGGFTLLSGGHFQSEELVAYEAGYRGAPFANTTLSVSTFYNVYDDLRSVEFSPGPAFPLVYANLMEGDTYGTEIWGSYQVLNWWQLKAGFDYLQEDLRFKPGSSMLLGIQAAGDDPKDQVTLGSSFDLPFDLSFDFNGRYVSKLPNPAVPAYATFSAKLGWRATDNLDLAVSGDNLAGPHREFGAAGPTAIELQPSVLFTLRWRPSL